MYPEPESLVNAIEPVDMSGVNGSTHEHPYNSSQPLSRPDWPTKHGEGTKFRNLLDYIVNPWKYSDRVVRDSSDALIIKDKYPKAQVHLLVLPKWLPHRDLHPHDAFEDPDFLAMVRREGAEGLRIAISMLETKMHEALLQSGADPAEASALLSKRDFEKDFQIGIHAHPSQHELHVHIISRDMVSWHPYGPRHYQAFNTPFLVPLRLYPLPQHDQMRKVSFQNANLLKEDFDCWRCGKYFGTDWPSMRKHLDEEYQGWIREE